MFTGLIETTGTITAVENGAKACTIALKPGARDFVAEKGDSISMDGVCLTVEKHSGPELAFTAVKETLDLTTLGALRPGAKVNLERSLAASGRLHGHLVLGHSDGIAEILAVKPEGASLLYTIRPPRECLPLLSRKGSVAIDGISLTIASVHDDCMTIAVIPETQKATTLAGKKPGGMVNIECDVLARYVHRALQVAAGGAKRPGTGKDLLATMERLGF